MAKTVPSGWTKGEPLTIKILPMNGVIAWYVQQVPLYCYTTEVPATAVSACWFYEWEKFSEFIQWWFALEQEQDVPPRGKMITVPFPPEQEQGQ